MEEKKSHTKNERSLPDHEEQELWFSALAADDSCAYNVDKAFDRFVSRTQLLRFPIGGVSGNYRTSLRISWWKLL